MRLPSFGEMHLPILCAFFIVGAALGHIGAQLLGGDSELSRILQQYAVDSIDRGPKATPFFSILSMYLREPLLAFALGFCSFGAVAIPILLALQGFTLSFAAASLAVSLGRSGAVLSLASFGIRGIVVIVSTLLLSLWSFHRLTCSREEQTNAGATILLPCVLFILLGITLEITVVPNCIFSALKTII